MPEPSGPWRWAAERGRVLVQWARALPPIAVDAAIAGFCYVAAAIQVLLEDRAEWWVFVFLALNALPLVWRRRYPFAVAWVTGVGTTVLDLTDILGDLPYVQLVATYTFAALCPPLKRFVAVLGTVAGVSLTVLPDDAYLSFGRIGLFFAVAYALGTGARARRDRIAMLEERSRRLAEEHEVAAARERERIARDLHDVLAHSMSLVAVQAEAGPVVVRTDPDKAEEVFDTISATARDALAQLRRALGVLRSDGPGRQPQPDLDGLEALVASTRRAGLAATLEVRGEPRPAPADVAVTAYRIVQESLTNTLRHADASQVQVRLDWRGGDLHLEVSDDGHGPAGGDRPGGHGLIGMRERVAAVGGELGTGAGPGGVGFRVAASLPLPR